MSFYIFDFLYFTRYKNLKILYFKRCLKLFQTISKKQIKRKVKSNFAKLVDVGV